MTRISWTRAFAAGIMLSIALQALAHELSAWRRGVALVAISIWYMILEDR